MRGPEIGVVRGASDGEEPGDRGRAAGGRTARGHDRGGPPGGPSDAAHPLGPLGPVTAADDPVDSALSWPRPVPLGGPTEWDDASFDDEARRRLIVEERGRIARELHTDLLHSLFEIAIVLQGTAVLVDDGPVAERIDSCVVNIDACIRRIREHVFDLSHEEVPRALSRW